MRTPLPSTTWVKPSERLKRRAADAQARTGAVLAAEQSLLRRAAAATQAVAEAARAFNATLPDSAARRDADSTMAVLADRVAALLGERTLASADGARALAQMGLAELPRPWQLLAASDSSVEALGRAGAAFAKNVNGFIAEQTAAAVASARAGATGLQAMVLNLPGFAVALDASTDPPLWSSNAQVPLYARDVSGAAIDVRGSTLPEHLDKLVALARQHRYSFTVAGKTYAWGDSATAGFVERQ